MWYCWSADLFYPMQGHYDVILLISWPVLPNGRTVWCDTIDQLICFTQWKDYMMWCHWSADLFYPMEGQYDVIPLISWSVSPNARTIWCDTVDQLTCFTQWKDYMMWYCWSADLFHPMEGQYDVIPLISWPVSPNGRTIWCDAIDQLTCFTQCKDYMMWYCWSADLFHPMEGQYDVIPLISWPVLPNGRTIWFETIDQLTCFTQCKDNMMWYRWSADLFYLMEGLYDVILLISWPVLLNERTIWCDTVDQLTCFTQCKDSMLYKWIKKYVTL